MHVRHQLSPWIPKSHREATHVITWTSPVDIEYTMVISMGAPKYLKHCTARARLASVEWGWDPETDQIQCRGTGNGFHHIQNHFLNRLYLHCQRCRYNSLLLCYFNTGGSPLIRNWNRWIPKGFQPYCWGLRKDKEGFCLCCWLIATIDPVDDDGLITIRVLIHSPILV